MKKLYIIVLLFLSCNQNSDEFTNILIPEHNVTIKSLEKQNFIVIPETELLFGKQFADTFVHYHFKRTERVEDEVANSRFCKFKLSREYFDPKSFFKARNCIYVKEDEDSLSVFFTLIYTNQNLVFKGSFYKKDSIVSVGYDYQE